MCARARTQTLHCYSAAARLESLQTENLSLTRFEILGHGNSLEILNKFEIAGGGQLQAQRRRSQPTLSSLAARPTACACTRTGVRASARQLQVQVTGVHRPTACVPVLIVRWVKLLAVYQWRARLQLSKHSGAAPRLDASHQHSCAQVTVCLGSICSALALETTRGRGLAKTRLVARNRLSRETYVLHVPSTRSPRIFILSLRALGASPCL